MLRNRYLIAVLGLLLLAVLGWNISFFAGRRAVPGRQGGAVSVPRAAGVQMSDIAARSTFPVGQDTSVWRRDPFVFGRRPSTLTKTAVIPDMAVKEDAVDLQGIVVSDGKRFALVDGWVVGVGDRVRDYSVAVINPYSIVLKGDRGTREVSIIHETVKEK